MNEVKKEPVSNGLVRGGSTSKRDQEFDQLIDKFKNSIHLISDPVKFQAIEGKDGKPRVSQVRMRDPKKRALHFLRASDAFGTCHEGVMNLLLTQVAQTFHGILNSEGTNHEKLAAAMGASIALLGSIKPQDSVESMLAVQMVGVHNLGMETLKRAMTTDQTFEGKEANITQATRMLRTFIFQMEALKRYRTGGQQKVVVEHVNISQGGQAIVGMVNQGGRENEQS